MQRYSTGQTNIAIFPLVGGIWERNVIPYSSFDQFDLQ